MISFIEVSANIGAINTKGIKGFFNSIYKLKCKIKVKNNGKDNIN